MTETIQVKDIMTRGVLTVGPEDTLDKISQLFDQHDFDGIPVIAQDGKLLGIITAYDMVVQSSGMHLPTIIGLLKNIAVNGADQKELDQHFNRLRQITAKQIMNTKPITTNPNLSLDVVAQIFAEHHRVNPLPVVDDNGYLVGVISRYDVIKFFNETYFKKIMGTAQPYHDQIQSIGPTKSEREIESAMGEISKEFLLVTKKRPTRWRYAAAAAFIAGLIGATALIINIVKRGG